MRSRDVAIAGGVVLMAGAGSFGWQNRWRWIRPDPLPGKGTSGQDVVEPQGGEGGQVPNRGGADDQAGESETPDADGPLDEIIVKSVVAAVLLVGVALLVRYVRSPQRVQTV